MVTYTPQYTHLISAHTGCPGNKGKVENSYETDRCWQDRRSKITVRTSVLRMFAKGMNASSSTSLCSMLAVTAGVLSMAAIRMT